jgi:hypothetical protein
MKRTGAADTRAKLVSRTDDTETGQTKKKTMRILSSILVPLLLSIPNASLIAQTIDFDHFGYGPFDYTNLQHFRDRLPVVENNHFNADVDNLTGTMAGGLIGAHLLYTIRSFPNHHRALVSVTKLWAEYGTATRPPPGVAPDQTPDFLYRRAISFAPTDGMVRLLYGIYLLDVGREEEAIERFDQAAALAPDNVDINYNLGLMYLRVNEREKADIHASTAYEQGYPLPGLRNKMIAAGIWSR